MQKSREQSAVSVGKVGTCHPLQSACWDSRAAPESGPITVDPQRKGNELQPCESRISREPKKRKRFGTASFSTQNAPPRSGGVLVWVVLAVQIHPGPWWVVCANTLCQRPVADSELPHLVTGAETASKAPVANRSTDG